MRSNMEILGQALCVGLIFGLIGFIRFLFIRGSKKKNVAPCFDDPVLLREKMKDQQQDDKEKVLHVMLITSLSVYPNMPEEPDGKTIERIGFISFLIISACAKKQFELGRSVACMLAEETSLIMTKSKNDTDFFKEILKNRFEFYSKTKPFEWGMLMTNMMASSIYNERAIIITDKNILRGIFNHALSNPMETSLDNAKWIKYAMEIAASAVKLLSGEKDDVFSNVCVAQPPPLPEDDVVSNVCVAQLPPLPEEDVALEIVHEEDTGKIEEGGGVCRRSFPWLRCGGGVCVLGVLAIAGCYLFDFLQKPKCVVINNLEGDTIVLNTRDISCVDFSKDDEDTAIKDESEECSVMLANGRRIDVDKSTARMVFLGICEDVDEANARFAEEDRLKEAQDKALGQEIDYWNIEKRKFSSKEILDAIFCGDVRKIPFSVKARMEKYSGERYGSNKSIRYILGAWAVLEGGYSEEEIEDDLEFAESLKQRLRSMGRKDIFSSLGSDFETEEVIYIYLSQVRKEGYEEYILTKQKWEKSNRK